jgi:hypothetical protein
MKRLYSIPVLVLLTALLFAACKKKEQAQPTDDYIPCRVLFGVKDGTPVESVFALADSEGLQLLSVSFYNYVAPYAKDSLLSISDLLLNTKPYINKPAVDTIYKGYTFNVSGWAEVKFDSIHSNITVSCTLMNMDLASQTDWINTKEKLGLIDKTQGGAMIYVKVPPGQEQAVISRIKYNPIVSYADVNHVGQVQL